MFNIKTKKGFTLIELLVVIGILAVLAAIAIPSVAGLIDRANVSADNSNATAMTNAIEQFTSEFELVKQDIASGVLDENDLDAVQGRIFNIFEITMRSQVVHLENEDGINGYGVNINTKYPVNEKTFKSVITHYLKTTSDTFIPKQSDKAFYYSPEIGVVIVAEDGSTTDELNKVALVDEDGVSVNNKGFVTLSTTPLADDIEDNNIQWINLTLNALNLKKGMTETNVYVSTDTKNQYTTLRKDVLGYQEYDSEGSGLFVQGTNEYIKINVNGKQVDATWKNLIQGDYIRVVNGELGNGSNVSQMSGELVVGPEIASTLQYAWAYNDGFLSTSRITSVIFKEGITSLGDWSLGYMNNIESITIPSTVSSIGEGFLIAAPKLKTIVVSEDNQYFTVLDNVLYTKDFSELIKYPSMKSDTTYYVHENTVKIRNFACRSLTYLTNIYFGDKVTTIGNQAFEYSYKIENVYFGKECNIPQWAAFRDCLYAKFNVDTENSKMKIYDNVIYDANMTKAVAVGYQSDNIVNLKDGISSIEFTTLAGQGGTSTIIIPKSVTSIGGHSFHENHVKYIKYTGTETEFNKIYIGNSGDLITPIAIEKANITYNYNP